jgi:hypothetical protein
MHFYRGFVAIFVLGSLFGTVAIVADHGLNLSPVCLLVAYGAAAIWHSDLSSFCPG